jgi:hypothetical protein
MTDFPILLNATCNVIIFLSMLMFIIFVFGRKNSKVYIYGNVQAFILKFGLVSICIGSFLNILTFSNPPYTELILNVGLAAVFFWGAIFHYLVFVAKKEPNKPINNKETSKSINEIKLGSTWLFSLLAQVLNFSILIYLFSNLCEMGTAPLIASGILLLLIQGWSFYSIFKTIKLRSSLKAPSKRKLARKKVARRKKTT